VSLPRRLLIRSLCSGLVALSAFVPAAAQTQTVRMPMLPLTQLDERGASADLDHRALTLTFAHPVPITDVLLMLVRGTSLNLIPDPAISGTFIGELKNVTVRQALDSILPPRGLSYKVDKNFIRVAERQRDTRIFNINYIASGRSGAVRVGRDAGLAGPSAATISTTTSGDVFSEITTGVRTLLSQGGSFNLDRQAGLLQVTDFADRLDRMATYLDAVEGRIHRQVELDARFIEIELSDAASSGVDWGKVSLGLPAPSAAGAPATIAAGRRPLTGLKLTDVAALYRLLGDQGKVETLQSARMTTMNNEPALLRSDALTLNVTPQIAPDGVVTLSVTPLVDAASLAEADTLARVASGETLVISGFGRTREVRERRNVGKVGGWFGRGTVVTRKRIELVILLTPKVL
jgi:type II secretory pathway component GspD/PulD (secretin)